MPTNSVLHVPAHDPRGCQGYAFFSCSSSFGTRPFFPFCIQRDITSQRLTMSEYIQNCEALAGLFQISDS